MLKKLYMITSILIISVYALASWSGWELDSESRDTVPASVRQSPGGYRSYHFWHSGYSGGK